jgi:hypothetical protein
LFDGSRKGSNHACVLGRFPTRLGSPARASSRQRHGVRLPSAAFAASQCRSRCKEAQISTKANRQSLPPVRKSGLLFSVCGNYLLTKATARTVRVAPQVSRTKPWENLLC